MRRRSSSTAGIAWLDRAERIEAVRRAVERAAGRLPLRRAILFGSLAAGRATSRSDADLLLVLASSPHPRPRDRVPDALEALRPLPCPIDLFVLTQEELARLRSENSPFLRAIDAAGIDLLQPPARDAGRQS